jgi:glycerol-3-phosphate acyltransferase PlsY
VRRPDPPAVRLMPVVLAFAAGCLPSARLVLRTVLADPSSDKIAAIEEIGDGKPGASNVYRAIGPLPGISVALLDVVKAFAPAAALKWRGAPDGIVAAAAAAPIAAHVTVVGGQGAASALGAALALDTPATLVALVPVVGGTVLGYHPQGVLGGMLVLPVAHGLLRRRWRAGIVAAAIPAILIGARLRGRRGSGPPRTLHVAANRLLMDRDE